MKKIGLLYLILFACQAFYASPHLSRNYTYRHYTTRDGLPQMQVMCAFQDIDGFIWFGTKGGISRFDGFSFKNYTTDDGLFSGEVHSLYNWGSNLIVVHPFGMSCLYPNDSVVVFPFPNNDIIDKSKGSFLPIDKDIAFVFNIRKNHYIFYLKEKKFVRLTGFDETVLLIHGDTLVTRTGLFRRNRYHFTRLNTFPFCANTIDIDWVRKYFYIKLKNSTIYCYHLENKAFTLKWTKHPKSIVSCRAILKDGTFIEFENNGKNIIYPSRKTDFGIKMTFPVDAFVDKENNLWVCSENGLYNYFNLNIEEYKFNLSDPDNIWSILEDNNNSMWFGSYGKGLWKLNTQDKLSEIKNDYYRNDLQYMGSFKSNDGTLYFPYANGIAKFQNGKLKEYVKTGSSLSVFYDENKHEVIYSGVDSITNLKGLYVGMSKMKQFYPWNNGFPICIIPDNKGRIHVGSHQGQGIFTGDSLVTDKSTHEYHKVICMSPDNRDRLWKGTETGVYVELSNGKEFRLDGSRISGTIYSILVYHDKYLLVGGSKSLIIVDIQNLKSYATPELWEIGYDAGFTGLESGQNGFCEDHNGYVWLTTALNVIKFNPVELINAQTNAIPPLRLASLSYSKDNSKWNTQIFTNKTIELKSSNKYLRFDYVANSISAPKSLRFKYRLIGFSDSWSEPVHSKSVSYTNIGYGKYEFEVQGSLDGVHWSAVAKSPTVEIIMPFYQRPIFILIYILFQIVLIMYLTRVFVKRSQKKKHAEINRQKLENELQLKTLRSKVIPHFSKNVLSAIGHFAMTDKLKAGHYISVFSRFTELTLANADKNYITLNEELTYIQNYLELEKMRFGERFDFIIDMSEIHKLNIMIPSMTLHTYCDNAIRHGLVHKNGDGLLYIKLKKNIDGLLICITDNGIGRNRANELGTHGNGEGLKLIQAQLDLFNQNNEHKIWQKITDLEDAAGVSAGTKVELFIPDGYKFS